jgi:hypothetical protein
LATGKSLADLTAVQMYDVAMALLARQAEKTSEMHESADRTLDSVFPLPKVEQTRTADGTLEYNPDMEIPGWGYADLPDFAVQQGPASGSMPDQTTTHADGEVFGT